MAEVPGALHEERTFAGPQGSPADGGSNHPHRLFAQSPMPKECPRAQWQRVTEGFRGRFPRLAELMEEAEEDLLSYATFPAEHWQKIWSNNPLERLNRRR
jgi:Transposase, Mutator family